jgi:hypothetical protein
MRFLNKNIIVYFEKRSSLLQRWNVVENSEVPSGKIKNHQIFAQNSWF